MGGSGGFLGVGGALGADPGTGSGGASNLPPETESESSFQLPVQSGHFIWSANPKSGNVAVIDARTLGVKLARAGFGPTFLAALPTANANDGAAVVLNTLGRDAAVLRLHGDTIDVQRVPTHDRANAWAISPDGHFAIAWSDASAVKNADPADSFQDITVIDVSEAQPVGTRLSVGFRPNRVFFDASGTRAFVASLPGITVIDLSQRSPSVIREMELTDSESSVAIDVTVLPDGSRALYRVEGRSFVGAVDLRTGARSTIPLSGPVTDLDLIADGSAAIAVVRGQPIVTGGEHNQGGAAGDGGQSTGGSAGMVGSEAGGAGGNEAAGGAASVAAGGAGDGTAGDGTTAAGGADAVAGATSAAGGTTGGGAPATAYGPSEVFVLRGSELTEYDRVEIDDLVGSVAVAPNGARAVLYTTATPLERVTLLDCDPGSNVYLAHRRAAVRAPVRAVFVAPDAAHALISLQTADAVVKGAFAVVPLAAELPVKIQTTDAPVTGVAFAPAPSTSAILTAATGHTAYLVHLPALRVDLVSLPSLPLSAGILSDDNAGYVAQQHPDGRLSVIDLTSAESRTLTGFELGGNASNDY